MYDVMSVFHGRSHFLWELVSKLSSLVLPDESLLLPESSMSFHPKEVLLATTPFQKQVK